MNWIALLLASVLLISCTAEPQSYSEIVPASTLKTYEITSEPDDSYTRWQAYNEQRLAQDKWEAYVDEEEHELEVDVDADDFVQCENTLEVDINVKNLGTVDEQVRVTLHNDKLTSQEKIVDVEYGHTRTVQFDVNIRNAPRGDYVFKAEVFRDIEFDRNGDIKDEGEYEGTDSEKVFVSQCD